MKRLQDERRFASVYLSVVTLFLCRRRRRLSPGNCEINDYGPARVRESEKQNGTDIRLLKVRRDRH